MKHYSTLLLTFNFLLITNIFSQTGPGGVGNSSSNVMWLSGDGASFTDLGTTPATAGQTVRQWNDRSGNGNHGLQNTAGNRPIYRTGVANGMPALSFTGDLFIDGPSLGMSSTLGYTYFITFQDTASITGGIADGNGQFILDRTTATNNLVSLKPITGNVYAFQKRNDAGAGIGGPLTTTSINPSAKIIQMRRDYNVDYQIRYNGALQGTAADADGATAPPEPRIGRHATTTNGGLRGYINEFIIYNFALNFTQTIIVNNYLSAKYNIALGSNDLYVHDDAGFDFDVAGIGRTSAADMHTDAQGSGILRINNASDLNDNEYLIWGHNNLNPNATTTSNNPFGVQARLARTWRVAEVNISGTAVDVGAVDMTFDLTDNGSITAGHLVLIIDTNNDGDFSDETPISGATHISGNLYRFSGVTALSNGVRFTIGTSNVPITPLPVEIINFNAKVLNANTAIIEWSTVSETNNSHFTIQKSSDGINWTKLTDVNGVGNSSQIQKYEVEDKNIKTGLTYYKLSQTDFDGTETEIGIRMVINESKPLAFKVYPNPCTDVLTIEFENIFENTTVQVLDMFGKIIIDKIITDQKINIELPEAKGVYIVRIKNGEQIINHKLQRN